MTPDEWDLIVPADDADLVADLRRHGVRPGSHLHIAIVEQPTGRHDPRPAYFGSFTGPADLAQRSEEILRAETGTAER